MVTKKNLIAKLLTQKADQNNVIDLNAYASALDVMFDEISKLHINDLKQLFPKAFAPLIEDIETIASYIEADLECKNINENAALDDYLIFSEKYLHFGWVCTDPDNKQYCKKASEGHYHGKKLADGHYLFKELNPKYKLDPENECKWIEEDIILKAFTDDQINNHISAYYSSIDQIKELYGEDWELVVAECIFEQESGLY